ncbi:anti-sigma factor [Leifsonia sp. F6_8S_P_1B]|uniref:Anti-sigma factor n=1 Tax=Leifsonia williamsii TaxID=3035919 RepID=A0ABT8KD85_9MICO|nr:anti-sigma factor [Leifsonia williamsii]MDN4614279.1 anti-sigma factor [Leifsonia williamsii]
MTHSDPDALAMLALGDPEVDEADVEHVMGCPECRAELDRLMRVTRAARENGPVDFELLEPSPAVWEGIRAQIAAEATAGADDPAPAEPVAPVQTLPHTPGRRPAPGSAPSRPAGRPARSRRRWVAALSGAAVLLVAVVVAATVFLRPGQQSTVEAQATLAGLPAWSTSSGTATMEREPDGTTVLQVALESPAVEAGGSDYREVWLMNSDLTKSISVGLLDGGSGRFVMPPNIAAADYPVVDISQQPLNGDPGHSGDSIVRGTLTASG